MGISNLEEIKTWDIQFATPKDHEHHFNSGNQSHSEDEGELISTSYLLLDLPVELLDQVKNQLKNEEKSEELNMEFRAGDNEEVVLTLTDQTYQLRTVQNSNSVMICGTDKNSVASKLSVLKVVHETLELTDTTKFPGTRLERVKQLLQPHLYTGETNDEIQRQEDSDSKTNPSIVTLSSLSEEVRASDAEIENHLKDLHIVELNGALRMMSLGYLSNILSGLLKALEDLQVSPQEEFAIKPVIDIITSRSDIHPIVFLQILSKFSSYKFQKTLSHQSIDSLEQGLTASLNVEEIVNLIGLSQLLSIKPTRVESNSNSKNYHYTQIITIDNFLSTWKSKLTAATQDYCSIKSLKSHSIISNDEKSLIVIPINKLSLEPKIRISQLFEIQAKWKFDEIIRFLLPVTGGGIQKKIDELILKFCRKTKDINNNFNSSKKIDHVSETVWLSARNKW